MKKDILQRAAEDLEDKQAATIKKKAEQANVRAVELLWSGLLQKHYSYMPARFTGVERQAVRNLVNGYGIHNFLLYLTGTVKNWANLKETKELLALPRIPTFQIFCHYHRIITPLIDIQIAKKIEEEEKKVALQKEKEEQTNYRPPKSLTEMVLEQKRKHGATTTNATAGSSK